ncbi:hypothetical protein ASPCAL09376 [Aspergillus calidoustus]|uniref:Uncharacterized protein n=1 Tax=Aspergillus calidoustus TaxID=454130 RepID=A0A0U5A3P4_ASPCI|nr:hypothetical protein ASPCAL09376 [Aspergillus calidoustus]
MEPIRLGLGDEIPGWGYLPAEQYLIRHWNPASPESPDQQRESLIQEFLSLDEIPKELDATRFGTRPFNQDPQARTPTKEEIATILRPWRSDMMRVRAWKLWKQGADYGHPVLLRTYYDPNHDDRVECWTPLGEYWAGQTYWSFLDDRRLFDFEGNNLDWKRVFHVLPEISKLDTRYSRLRNMDLYPEFRTNFKDSLDTVKRAYPTQWRNNLNLLLTENDAAISLLYFLSTTQMLIADRKSFQTDQFLLVLLDAKQNVTMQCRIEITEERLDCLSTEWGLRELPMELEDQVTIGPEYLVDGEQGKVLYQWTKQDLEGDPASDVEGATTGASHIDI